MVWHLDEPYGGGLPSWYVFREMSKDVKVGLTGIGGDELFGNYGKFRIYEASRLVQASLAWRRWAKGSTDILAHFVSPVAALTKQISSSWRWIGRGRLLSELAGVLGQPFGRYYYANFDYLSDDRKRDIVLGYKTAIYRIQLHIFRTYMTPVKLRNCATAWPRSIFAPNCLKNSSL